MLQRIQTIWLLLAFACGFLTLKFSFFSGNKLDANNVNTYTSLLASSNILILILTVAIFMAAVIAIFLFKNRKLQLRIILVTFLVSLLNIFLYYRETQKFVNGEYSITATLTIAIPIFLLLAARGIYKDEKLVKSMDRLR
jgi:drug/metabolite transporter (DMT)-like permease